MNVPEDQVSQATAILAELEALRSRCGELETEVAQDLDHLFDERANVRNELMDLYARFCGDNQATRLEPSSVEECRSFQAFLAAQGEIYESLAGASSLGWEDIQKLVNALNQLWRTRLSQEVAKAGGPYTRRALGDWLKDISASKRLVDAVKVSGRGYALLYGPDWDKLTYEIVEAMKEPLSQHSAIGREIARRESWWLADNKAIDEFNRGVYHEPDHRTRGGRLRQAFATHMRRARSPAPAALPVMPQLPAVPRSRDMWRVLRAWFGHCCQEAQALNGTATRLADTVGKLESEEKAFAERVGTACDLDIAALDAVMDKNSRYRSTAEDIQHEAESVLHA